MTDLRTFCLPTAIIGQRSDMILGQEMIRAWRADGIFQIAIDQVQHQKTQEAIASSKRFFAWPLEHKSRHISEWSYSGYIASGEEVTAGQADNAETFTVCKDLPLSDARVRAGWPCHGPVPWPDEAYQHSMQVFMDELGGIGEKLLRLIALGLGLARIDALTDLTFDGWHHMRVMRFPARSARPPRSISAHTDYGLLAIAAQDDVGGLYIRPPVEGEHRSRNWRADESSAGMYENQEPWHFVKPAPGVLTVFPGDILQFLTGGLILSTPHQVKLNTRERFAITYFHEPNFEARVYPLFDRSTKESIHYGTHVTNMLMRCYPARITTRRILEDDRLSTLSAIRQKAPWHALAAASPSMPTPRPTMTRPASEPRFAE